jgi:hypothetical protein
MSAPSTAGDVARGNATLAESRQCLTLNCNRPLTRVSRRALRSPYAYRKSNGARMPSYAIVLLYDPPQSRAAAVQ